MLPRDHLLALHLRDTLKVKVVPREPKEPFKHLISKLLRNKLGLNINTEGPLRMTVVMAHEPTATEHMFLTQAKNPVLKVRKKQRKVRHLSGKEKDLVSFLMFFCIRAR